MPSLFQHDAYGPFIEVDPGSDLDYSLSSWLEDMLFLSAAWTLSPPVAGALHDDGINASPVTVDGVVYAVGELAYTWVKSLVAGTTYTLTLRGTFTGNRIDERSVRLICKEL